MSMAKVTKGLFPGFTQLAPTVWYYVPSDDPTASNGVATRSRQPDLIVLCTWMGAAPKHVLKYIVGFQGVYPRSPILMMTNDLLDIVLRRSQSYKNKMKPAVKVIHDAATSHQNPQILLHLFSNGGANCAATLAYLYRQQFDSTLPISGMVLDSAPGVATYRRSIAAMAVSLPHFILFRVIGLVFIHLMCAAMWVTHHIFRQENIISKIRKQLRNPNIFPTSAPRVYIYSKADKMVGWKDVEFNAQLTKDVGYTVRTERYENSPHVGHLREDPERYWNTVRSVMR